MEEILYSGSFFFALALLAGITSGRCAGRFMTGVVMFGYCYFMALMALLVAIFFKVELPLGQIFALLIISGSVQSTSVVLAIWSILLGWFLQLFFPFSLALGIIFGVIILVFGFFSWIRG